MGSQINCGSKIIGRRTVYVGRHAVIGYNCILMSSSDSVAPRMDDASKESDRDIVSAPIIIGDYAYIGSGSIISPGAHIGEGAVVSALTYIKKFAAIKDYSVVRGSPLKLIKERPRK